MDDNNKPRLRRKSPTKAATTLNERLSQVNDVRNFISKANPSQLSLSSSKNVSASHYQRDFAHVTKKDLSASAAKHSVAKKNLQSANKQRHQMPYMSPHQRRSPTKVKMPPGGLKSNNSIRSTKERDSPNIATPLDGSSLHQLDSSKLNGLKGDQDMMSMRKTRQQEENINTTGFSQKSKNIEDSEGVVLRPDDRQIAAKYIIEDTIEEPTADQLEADYCRETLLTQIGVEETNIKTIGVSGSKPKYGSGSLTERQSHLVMSQTSNGYAQQETSIQNSIGPSLSRRLDKSEALPRGGTVDNRHFHNNQLLIGSGGRRSLGSSSQDRVHSASGLTQTQVSPFQQRSLINVEMELNYEDFTAKLRKLKNLDKIDLSQNKIAKIPYPELLNHSQTLTQLCLDSNKIAEIAEETMRQMPCLSTLRLRANQLRRLPDSIFSLASLKVLDVSSNLLTALSPKVSLLRQLRWLDIAENRLDGLPSSIGYLDSLDSVTSEYFVYLPDQNRGSANAQIDTVQHSGDPELECITRHHQRRTIARNGIDARFDKLMKFLRRQIEITSTFIDLVHEFQHIQHDQYPMLDSEAVIATEESDLTLGIHHVPSMNVMHSPSQMFGTIQAEHNQMLTSDELLALSKLLPRLEYNELVTVFRTLQIDSNQADNGSMLHSLIINNHPHLLKQFACGIERVIKSTTVNLQSSEINEQKLISSKGQNLIQNLQVSFDSKIKFAVNGVNDKGLNTLDLVLQATNTEIADVFLRLFGKYLDLSCQPAIAVTPRSEIRVIVPGNQQNHEKQQLDPNRQLNDVSKRIHPIVATLSNGRFQLASKLVDVALDCHFRRKAEEQSKLKQEKLHRESQQSLSLSLALMNHAALRGGQGPSYSFIDTNAPFTLNSGDCDAGMTLLHHLFSNFDAGPDKAASLFRKLNSLHLRHIQPGGKDSSQSLFGRLSVSPANYRNRMKSARTVTGSAVESKLSATAQKQVNQQASSIFLVQGTSPRQQRGPDPKASPRLVATDIKPLEVNPVTHYFETPFEMAVEHFQNSAIQFALNWNYNHVMNIQFTKQHSQQEIRSKSTQRQQPNRKDQADTSPNNTLKFAIAKTSEPTMKDFFYLMCQSNPRKLSPLHRAVICGNFNALKLLLDSPLCSEAHSLGKSLSHELRKWTIIDLRAQDKHGKTARDYSHKIVFMSKLLDQALKRHVWKQADLYSIDGQIRKKRQVVEESKQAKNGVLATYDKLISFQRRSKLFDKRQHQISQVFSGNLVVVRHTCLNFVFLNKNSANFNLSDNNGIFKRHHHTKALTSVIQGEVGPNSARNQDRRLVKSFAVLAAESQNSYREQTPFQVKTATGVIMTPSLLTQKQQSVHQQMQMTASSLKMQQNLSHGDGSSTIQRQSVPSTISNKGIKKAKSMAFNSLTNRLDRDSQARQFLNQAMMQQQQMSAAANQKQSVVNKVSKQKKKDSSLIMGTKSANSNSIKMSGSQSQLATLRKQDGQSNQTQKESVRLSVGGLESRYGKTQSSMISNSHQNKEIPAHQLYRDEEHQTDKLQDDQVASMGDYNTNDDDKLFLQQSQQVDSTKQQQLQSSNTTAAMMIIEKSPRKRNKRQLQLSKYPNKDMQRSVKVDANGLEGESLFAHAHSPFIRVDKLSPRSPISGPKMQFKKLGDAENQSDALKLADLQVEEIKVGKPTETSVELTHDFDDSGSANSFTPLPSIQNEYALEIKSFNNQWKKPYSQQLSTNAFKEQFNLIMDYQCDFDATFVEEEINVERLKNKTISSKMLSKELKPLRPHQKIQILYEIVKQAKHPYHKLQDAKDIFDFIQYEIGSQTQCQKKRVRLEAPAAVPIEQQPLPAAELAKQTKNKLLDNIISKNKLLQQQNLLALAGGSCNIDIIFLRQEVNYLRCQLDLIAKQMVAIPQTSREMMLNGGQGGYCQTTNTNNDRYSTSNVYDTQPVMTEQMTEPSVAGTFNSARVNKINSCRNASILEGVERQYQNLDNDLDLQQQPTLLTGCDQPEDEVTHLTEADQEFSDDFDENVNEHVKTTVRYKSKKQKVSRLVQPVEMLGGKRSTVTKTADSSGGVGNNNNNSSRQSAIVPQSSLTRLLKKTPKSLLQQQTMTSHKLRKSIKHMDKHTMSNLVSNSFIRSRENLETEEGMTMINQPLISAELQSFSDRLSQHRDSNKTTISVNKNLSSNINMFKKAKKSLATIKMLQRDKTPPTQQPNNKLKYAAFAHIDLSSFDFNQKQQSLVSNGGNTSAQNANSKLGLSKQNELLSEKSRSAIAIPKSLTFSANLKASTAGRNKNKNTSGGGGAGPNQLVRSATHMLSQENVVTKNINHDTTTSLDLQADTLSEKIRAGQRSQQYQGGILDSIDSASMAVAGCSSQVVQTEERQNDSRSNYQPLMMVQIREEKQQPPLQHQRKQQRSASKKSISKKNINQTSLLHRTDSFKQINSKKLIHQHYVAATSSSQQSGQVNQPLRQATSSSRSHFSLATSSHKKKSQVAGTSKNRQTMTNLATLTSQKISLKVLHDNQKSLRTGGSITNNNIHNNINREATTNSQRNTIGAISSQSATSGAQLKNSHPLSAAESTATITAKASSSQLHQQPNRINQLSQLSSHAIHLPPEKHFGGAAGGLTAKASAQATNAANGAILQQHLSKMMIGGPGSESRVNFSSKNIQNAKSSYSSSTYLQPKVVKYERPNFKVLSKHHAATKPAKVQPVSRNAPVATSMSTAQITSGTTGRTSLDAVTSSNMAQLKIRPHHRLLKDLMDRPAITKQPPYKGYSKQQQ